MKMIANSAKRLLVSLFEDLSCAKKLSSVASAAKKHDHLQEIAMKENCIVVDENDCATGYASKRDCHRVGPDGHLILHRAFSVFLFNTDGDLLMQTRSKEKITFPNVVTNTCCSHPLYDIEEEREESNQMGIRKAAQRRLHYELGVPYNQAKPEDFHYLTRIRYYHTGDGIWGEHELDYILFLHKNVDLHPNSNEISEIKFMKRDTIREELKNMKISPWFDKIFDFKLLDWWQNLHDLKRFEDHKNVHLLK